MATLDYVRRRIILLFVLGIGLPAILLGFLALRGVRNDQALLERERREELQGIASAVGDVHDSSLIAVGQALDSVLYETDSESGSALAPLQALAAAQPLIDGVFRLSPDGVVDELVAQDLTYRDPRGSFQGLPPPPSVAEAARWYEAQRLEFQVEDFRGALAAYQAIVASQSDLRIRVDATAGIARLLQKLGDYPGAMDAYRRLGSEFGDHPSDGGIPFRLVAVREMGRTDLLAGDTASAVETLVRLYAQLVRTERGLYRAQYWYMVARTRELLEEVFSTSERADLTAYADSVLELDLEDGAAKARTERLLAFQESAGGELAARGVGGVSPEDGRYIRASLSAGGQSFDLLLGATAREEEEALGGRWGVVLDSYVLNARIAAALRAEIGPQDIRWLLRGSSGEVLAASQNGPEPSGAVGNGLAAVRESLPGGIPPLTMELYQAEEGLVRSVLTSPYFYGFLLLAGILVFGLVLTVVTVSQQLALARLQSDFVSTVSHEFKSPLTAVRQVAETLQSGRVPSEEKRQRYYDILLEQSERLSLLINRVLDFARMDSGEHTFSVGPVDVGDFLEDAVSVARHRFGHEGFEIKSEIRPDLPTASFDADALGQAVSNLIDNAVKYSGESREVVVRGFTENGHVVFSVQDFGIGLDRREQDRVFHRFYRGGDALTRSVKGTGLGLTLVRQIAEGHGGWVDLVSEPGKGSTFIIRLPLEGLEE